MSDEMDFRPKRVPIAVDAGSSVSFHVTVADVSQIPNPVWKGQAKSLDGLVVEDFQVTPDATGASCVLFPAQTRALFDSNTTTYQQQVVGNEGSPATWVGWYDIQVGYDTGMLRTVVKGPLRIEEDVTT